MTKRPVSVMEQLESALQDVRAGRRRHVVVEAPPVPEYSASEVRRIRDALNMSQAEFAELLDVSPRSVQAWEQGVRAPGRGVCYLLEHYSSPDWVEKLRFPEPPARRPGSAGSSARRGRARVVAATKPPQGQVLVVKARSTRKSNAASKRAKTSSSEATPDDRVTAKSRPRKDH